MRFMLGSFDKPAELRFQTSSFGIGPKGSPFAWTLIWLSRKVIKVWGLAGPGWFVGIMRLDPEGQIVKEKDKT